MKDEKQTDIPVVDVIASGYEWICPNEFCNKLNKEIEYKQFCPCSFCGLKVELGQPEHAY